MKTVFAIGVIVHDSSNMVVATTHERVVAEAREQAAKDGSNMLADYRIGITSLGRPTKVNVQALLK